MFSDADFLKQITIDKLSSKSYEPYYDDLFYGPVKLNKETTFTDRKDENLSDPRQRFLAINSTCWAFYL